MAEALQVLFVSDTYPHYRAESVELLRSRFEVVVAAGEPHEGIPGAKPDVRLRRVPLGSRVTLLLGAIRAALFRKYDCLLIYANVYWPHVWACTVIGRLRGKVVIHWCHGWTGREPRSLGYIRRTLHSMANGLLLFGHHSMTVGIKTFGFPVNKVAVVGNSCGSVSLMRQLASPPMGEPAIIHVSRLRPERKLSLLLEAMAILRGRGVRLRALIVGNGPEECTLRHCVDELDLKDAVEFCGEIYDMQELQALYRRASLCVIPRYAGLATVQASGFGCPVIVSDAPTSNGPEWEVVEDGRSGMRFREGDATDLANKIALLLESATWEVMAAQALQRAELYSSERHAQRIADAIEAVERGQGLGLPMGQG